MDNSALVPGTANSSAFSWQNPNSYSAASKFNSPVFSSAPMFDFTASASVAVLSFPSEPSMFGNQSSISQMNTDDSMAEDTLQQSSNPTVLPVFGQPPAGASPSGFTFNSAVQSSSLFQLGGQPSQNAAQNSSPFQFSRQPNQGALQNASPFQGTGSLEFNGGGGGGGGSFVFGSGGKKSPGRKIVKVNRNKHRKRWREVISDENSDS